MRRLYSTQQGSGLQVSYMCSHNDNCNINPFSISNKAGDNKTLSGKHALSESAGSKSVTKVSLGLPVSQYQLSTPLNHLGSEQESAHGSFQHKWKMAHTQIADTLIWLLSR